MEETLAARILAAFGTGAVVEPAAADLPRTLDDAEVIEDAVAAGLGAIGGFKLGATIAGVRAALGVTRHFFGPVPQDRVFADGAELPAQVARQRGVESEYAFRLGRDLTGADAGLDEAGLAAAIDAVHPAIEIPGTRFATLGGHGGFALVADCGAVGSLVVGAARPLGDPSRFGTAPVILDVEGTGPVHGGGGVIDGGPFGPLLTFVRSALARGYLLRAGQVIASGSCTGYVAVPPGRRVTARFPALDAAVSLRFAESVR